MDANKSLLNLQILILFFLGISFEGAQAKPRCPLITNNIGFSVTVIPKNIDYHLGTSQNKLNKLANKSFKQQVLGLTSTKHTISAKMTGQTNKISRRLYCTQVTYVDITITVLNLDVYLLGKYPRGSCQYNAIIDHEHEHIATYQTGINNLEQTFNDKLSNMIEKLSPGMASTAKISRKIAFKNMSDSIARVRLPIEQAMKIRDKHLDSPLNYKMLSQKCASW